MKQPNYYLDFLAYGDVLRTIKFYNSNERQVVDYVQRKVLPSYEMFCPDAQSYVLFKRGDWAREIIAGKFYE